MVPDISICQCTIVLKVLSAICKFWWMSMTVCSFSDTLSMHYTFGITSHLSENRNTHFNASGWAALKSKKRKLHLTLLGWILTFHGKPACHFRLKHAARSAERLILFCAGTHWEESKTWMTSRSVQCYSAFRFCWIFYNQNFDRFLLGKTFNSFLERRVFFA